MKDSSSKTSYVGPQHVGQEILCVRNVSFSYADGTHALQDISFHVQRGSTLAVVGPNGAGKTTLLKILLGLLDGYSGQVEIAGLSPAAARRRGDIVSWVPQRQKMVWDFPVSVEQVVRMGLVGKTGLFRRHRPEDLAYVQTLLQALGIADIAHRPIGSVSGGQQQRAIIARALAPRPAILMLDEPTIGVDQAGQAVFSNLMAQIRQTFGVTLVIVSHDLRAVILECQRIACLNQKLHFHNSPSQLTPDILNQVFRCDLTGLFPVDHPNAPRAEDPPAADGPCDCGHHHPEAGQ